MNNENRNRIGIENSTNDTHILISRSVFFGSIIGFFVVFSVTIISLTLAISNRSAQINALEERANAFEERANQTLYAFHEHATISSQIQENLMAAASEALEGITGGETRARAEIYTLEREHQNTIASLLEQMNEFEELLRLFEEQRQDTINGSSD